MKRTERFDKAVTKLYNAFHNGKLISWDGCYCAVGNMINCRTPYWEDVRDFKTKDFLSINYKGLAKKQIERTGYSPIEIIEIERLFMGNLMDSYTETKETQFKGLCRVVEYLCELDGIPNVMDYTSLFEFDENGAKKELVL